MGTPNTMCDNTLSAGWYRVGTGATSGFGYDIATSPSTKGSTGCSANGGGCVCSSIGRAGSTQVPRAKSKAWMCTCAMRRYWPNALPNTYGATKSGKWCFTYNGNSCYWEVSTGYVTHWCATSIEQRLAHGIPSICCAPKCGSGTYFVWYLVTPTGCNLAYCVAGDPFSASLSG